MTITTIFLKVDKIREKRLKVRKGNFETVALAIVTFMLVGIIATLANTMLVDVNGVIRSQSVELTATRIERTAYGLKAFDDMKYQMDFGRRYKIFEEDRDDFVSFRFNNKEFVSPLNDDIEYRIMNPDDAKYRRYYCFNKTSASENVLIYRGKC